MSASSEPVTPQRENPPEFPLDGLSLSLYAPSCDHSKGTLACCQQSRNSQLPRGNNPHPARRKAADSCRPPTRRTASEDWQALSGGNPSRREHGCEPCAYRDSVGEEKGAEAKLGWLAQVRQRTNSLRPPLFRLLSTKEEERMTTNSDHRDQLAEMLSERGLTGVQKICDEVEESDLEAAIATVLHWDSIPSKTSGLLVHLLRERDFARPAAVAKAHASAPSEQLLRSMRGILNSPNGINREEAHGIYSDKAKRLNMSVDTLIDLAMGSEWQQSEPHPAFDQNRPREERAAAYEHWVAG